MVDSNGVIGQAEDTVKLAEGESKTRLLCSLREVDAGNGEVANPESVLGDEALHGARSILDREVGAIGLVGRRGR